MTIEKATLQAFERYAEMLDANSILAENHADAIWIKLTRTQQLSHCLWMIRQILHPSTAHYSIDKRSRWLGFIQAILIVHGITTIKNERDITRPWFTNQ